MQPLIVGISGAAGSGKDEAAAVFLEQLKRVGIRAGHMALAAPIKDTCERLFGMTHDEMHTFEGKKLQSGMYPERTNRDLLQKVGTECFRDVIGTNIWIDVLVREAVEQGLDVVVVSDIRFENEAAWVKRNGFLVRILPGFEGFEGIAATENGSHASEAGYEQIPDQIICNDSTLEVFQSKVHLIAEGLVVPMLHIVLEEARSFAIKTFRASIVESVTAFAEAMAAARAEIPKEE